MRQIDRPWHMPCRKVRGTANVQQNEAGCPRRERVMNIPAVGLESKPGFEVGECHVGRSGAYGGDRIGQRRSPSIAVPWVYRPVATEDNQPPGSPDKWTLSMR